MCERGVSRRSGTSGRARPLHTQLRELSRGSPKLRKKAYECRSFTGAVPWSRTASSGTRVLQLGTSSELENVILS